MQTGDGPVKSRSLDKAKLIFKYIESHYAENLTIKEMAEVCGFSQSHFMKFFKTCFGTSFVSYLREYRLTAAARLLLSSSSPVLTVAQETGFDNLSYFNRSFKAMYGTTPGCTGKEATIISHLPYSLKGSGNRSSHPVHDTDIIASDHHKTAPVYSQKVFVFGGLTDYISICVHRNRFLFTVNNTVFVRLIDPQSLLPP